jgi:hypothetical protein
VVLHHRRRSRRDGSTYLYWTLKLLAMIGLMGATHRDTIHAYIYVPAIVAVACSNMLKTKL